MTERIERSYYENGNISVELYYLNDKLHRDNGPAVIWYCKNQNIDYKAYYLNGKLHRDNGPTRIRYDSNGNIKFAQYYLNNIDVTKIYHEVTEILKELLKQYPNNENDLELIFILQYNDLYYSVFDLIKRENNEK